ncbi:MAG: flagellar hook-associated protein FlgK, partial [candidate division KSB1 bacterium]|nr:flagellar hook-associated protein FlgK [candidate division KSB1 bacterium]
MNVTGYNIANASRPDFSRQRVVIGAKDPLNLPHAVLGMGVEVETIKRIRDRFLDTEIRKETSGLGKWEYQEQILRQIELIFNEPSETGLNSLLSQFWESWQDLANDPESQAARTGVQQKAITLTNSFNRLDSQLRKLQKNLDEELKLKIEEINTLAQQIADLNRQIVAIEVGGDSANDYRDRRDSLLTQLAKLAQIDYKESEDGAVTVMVGKSSLVEREKVRELTITVRSIGTTSLSDIIWKDSGKYANLTDGQLKGIIELRDSQIPEYIRKLDELALGLVK